MGLYYAAVDNGSKVYFESPEGYSIKYPGICNPKNPFGCMVVMKNAQGYSFDIENDADWECFYSKEYKNITEAVYKEFITMFPWAEEWYEREE